MSNRRIVSSIILVGTCALTVVVGVANAGKGPDPRVDVPLTQPERSPLPPVSMPAGWVCPGTEGVQNFHVRLSPLPDYFAQGKALGMSDAEARAYVDEMAAAEKASQDQMLATVATLPPPPCR